MKQFYIYNGTLLLSWITIILSGTIRYRILDKAGRFFLWLVLLAFVTDLSAIAATLFGEKNVAVYNIGSILYTVVICFYFNEIIVPFRKCRLGVLIAILSILFGVVSSWILQPFPNENKYFRIYEMVLIISLSVTKIITVVIRPDYVGLKGKPHFWIAASLLVFWSFIFLHISLYQFMLDHYPSYKALINWSILIANVVNNLLIASILFFYPKFLKAHERSFDR